MSGTIWPPTIFCMATCRKVCSKAFPAKHSFFILLFVFTAGNGTRALIEFNTTEMIGSHCSGCTLRSRGWSHSRWQRGHGYCACLSVTENSCAQRQSAYPLCHVSSAVVFFAEDIISIVICSCYQTHTSLISVGNYPFTMVNTVNHFT